MKPHWRVFTDEPGGQPTMKGRASYGSQSEAEKDAERFARENPGKRYVVYEVVSCYIVDGLRREVPDELVDTAKQTLAERYDLDP